MSTLYLATDPRGLADQLADDLERQAADGDFFTPANIVVSNRYVKKWLRLRLARRLGVAINLRFQNLEESLWELLREVDPADHASPPEAVDDNTYRLMVLSILLESGDPDLAPLRGYLQLQPGGAGWSRLSCRRAWFLADRLGARIRDYEYNRQNALIQHWLVDRRGLTEASAHHQMMERAQRAVFRHITREPDGRRAVLNRHAEKNYKTFPQYAMELMTQKGRRRDVTPRVVHFFGFTQVSELHARTIAWLGQFVDVRFHHLNVLASRLDGNLQVTAEAMREYSEAENADCGRELLRLWGRAGAESLWLISHLKDAGNFEVKSLPFVEAKEKSAGIATVLGHLRQQLLGTSTSNERLPQDTSLQIVGCPGIAREVEAIYNSILHNLHADPSLKQTDIAVLVTDMPRYRAALQATFESAPAGPRRLQYNMVDFSAADISTYGQAFLGMLDLALESFSRSRVFQVILNPCFLARLGVDRNQAMIWLDWAENLGIYQGWDADEKHDQGYPRSPYYAWRLGLQRLRLGRFMDVAGDDDASSRRFAHLIPFADLESSDREQVDAFCRAVEGLLPTLARLRKVRQNGKRWAHDLARLANEYLGVPDDRPEEALACGRLLAAFDELASWDELHDTNKSAGLPLALVREFVQSQLDLIAGNRGEYLIGGVMISGLQPDRPLPFPIIYILGLGEDLFPGSNTLSSFDLRGAQRQNGDVRPAECRQYDLLAAILSAQRKLYLFYNNHDLQKDRPLLPAAPLQQLQHYLNRNVVSRDFEPVSLPTRPDDSKYLDPTLQPAHQDVLVQARDADRCLALLAVRADQRLALSARQEKEWTEHWNKFRRDFAIPAGPAETPTKSVHVSLAELRRYLQLPAHESLRRHLRVEEEDETTLEDDEPLVTTQQVANALARQTINQLIRAATQGDVDQRLAGWQDNFSATYADWRLRSRAPEEAFGAIDQAALLRDLQERIRGLGQIEAFVRSHAEMTFCGPVLLGESVTPLGARLRFPALRLRPGHELPADAPREIRITGYTPYAWQAPGRFEMLVVTNFKDIDGRELSSALFEPTLFHLALLASAEPNADGMCAQRLLAQREFMLHIAHRSGIQTWTYPRECITSAEALHYFVELTRDYLDATRFDLLPFEVIGDKKNKELRAALRADFTTQIGSDEYRSLLEEAIADVRENSFGAFQTPPLVDMIHAEVPADALAIVQRRFRLLDRGPASLRQRLTLKPIKRTRSVTPRQTTKQR
jgi:exonuclease V gamma subunit